MRNLGVLDFKIAEHQNQTEGVLTERYLQGRTLGVEHLLISHPISFYSTCLIQLISFNKDIVHLDFITFRITFQRYLNGFY